MLTVYGYASDVRWLFRFLVRGNEDEKHSLCRILSVVRVVFGVAIDFDVHDVGFGGSKPFGNGASSSLFAFFRFRTRLRHLRLLPPLMFSEKYLLRFSLIRHSERDVCV